MGYEYAFDAQPTVNGTDIKDILINGEYPDEVYCNGSHIAHLKKDVTVYSPRACFMNIARRSEVYENTDSCGDFINYARAYYITLQHYAKLKVARDPELSSGKRISEIRWRVYEYTGHSTSGVIENPDYKTYLIPTVTKEFLVNNDDYSRYNTPPEEDWDFTWDFRGKIKTEATIYYTDGTKVSVEDGYHSDKYTRISGLSTNISGLVTWTTANYTYTKQL